MGFSGVEKIVLCAADSEEHETKLSWHMNGNGGYRIGKKTFDNNSSGLLEFEKLVLFCD